MRLKLFVAAAAVLSASVAVHADVIYSNLATGSTNYANTAVEGSTVFNQYEAIAAAFTPTANSLLQETQVYVQGRIDPGATDQDFEEVLYSDGGGAPGTVLATLAPDLTAPLAGGVVDMNNLSFPLVQGTEYWFALVPYDSGSDLGWENNGESSVQTAVRFSSSGNWSAFPYQESYQFEIDGTVPEPSGLLLLGAGGFGFAARGRRRRASGGDGPAL